MSIHSITDQKALAAPLVEKRSEELKDDISQEVDIHEPDSMGAVYTKGDKTCQISEDTEKEDTDKASGNQEESQNTGKQTADPTEQMTEDDYKALEEEGMSLEKFELERLNKMLSRVKEERAFKEAGVEAQKAKLTEDIQANERIAYSEYGDQEIIDRLKDYPFN